MHSMVSLIRELTQHANNQDWKRPENVILHAFNRGSLTGPTKMGKNEMKYPTHTSLEL